MRTARPLSAALLSLLVILAISGTAFAGHSSGGSSFNVTTTINDTDANGVQTLMRSDDYNGIGQASYSATLNPNVVSNVSNGVLFFELYRQTLRTMFITPNDPYSPAQNPPVPIPPPNDYSQYVEVNVHCYDQNLNLVPLENVVTSSGNCRLGVDFGYAGVKYKLEMGPVLAAPGPATGLVNVNCNAVSGTQCISWTITPNPNGGLANVANLYYWARGGKLTYIGGQYYNTFRINLTNP